MKSTVTATIALLGALAAAAPTAQAHGDVVVGAVLGAGAGAVIGQAFGGREGAIVGGAIGAVTGTAITTGHSRTWSTQPVHYAPPVQAWQPPPQVYYPPARVYYPPPRAYYPPPREYYPAPVYLPAPVYAPPPAVIWRGHPGYAPGYGRVNGYGYGHREWR